MFDFGKKKKVVIKYDANGKSMIAWEEGRFTSHSTLLSDLKEMLKEKYGDKFHITDVVKLQSCKVVGGN
jgi:hypothetical protein